MILFVRRCCALGLLLLSGFALCAAEPDDTPAENRAKNKLAVIELKLAAPKRDAAKLRKELLVFRMNHPGTKAAIKAASLLATLPSALDRMDPATIPALEKFPWQPKELVAVLGEHRGRHGAAVTGVAVSHDNKFVASVGAHYLRIWNAATMRLEHLLPTAANLSSVAWTKDGRHVVVGSLSGGVYVWHVPEFGAPTLKAGLSASTGGVYSVACHPDARRFAAACGDNSLRLWEIGAKEVKEFATLTPHGKAIRAVAFAPDGKVLATGSDDETAKTFDVGDAEVKHRSTMEPHGSPVRSLAFAANGATLATGCADGTFRLWKLAGASAAKAPRLAHQGPKGEVTSLAFNASGLTLAATCGDNAVRLWNVSGPAAKERAKLSGHLGVAASVTYSPDQKLVVTGGADWMVRTWDLTKPKTPERFEPTSALSASNGVSFGPDDSSLVTGSEDAVMRVWGLDRKQPKTVTYLKGDGVGLLAVAFSPDGALIAGASRATRIRQWDALKGSPRAACVANPSYVPRVGYSPDGKYLFATSDKLALVYDAARGTAVTRVDSHETMIQGAAISPDGKLLATTSGYYLYDKAGKIVVEGGKYVYTDCVLRISDAVSGEEVAKDKGDQIRYGVAFAADGRTVYAGTYDSLIRRWAFSRDRKLTELEPWKATSGQAVRLIPSEDGRVMLSAGLEGKVILWEIATGKRLREWILPEYVAGLSLSTDGRHAAVGLGTGVILVLRLEAVDK